MMKEGILIGMLSTAGPCAENQDAVGARVPTGLPRHRKGMAFAIADGARIAESGRVAAETCVKNFLGDYFATPESWSVKRSGGAVLDALNRWLIGHGLRWRDAQRGCVSTFTGCILLGRKLHVFHVGDTRLYRRREGSLECLTRDHRVLLADGQPVLTRAMGLDHRVDIDFSVHDVRKGDIYALLTDGIHDRIGHAAIDRALASGKEAQSICGDLLLAAELAGTDDNSSAVVVQVIDLPEAGISEVLQEGIRLAVLPLLLPGQRIDGLYVEEILAESPRSQVYRVRDETSGNMRILKSPSPRCEDLDGACREYATENWVLRRVQHPRLPRNAEPPQPRSALYVLLEPVDGESLRAWMQRHRHPPVADALQLTRQITLGLCALHRREILHRDVRPENVLVDANGQVTLIDLGQCRVAGLAEAGLVGTTPGALEYAAPECTASPERIGERSDQFSVAALLYELLTGATPYGNAYVEAHHSGRFNKLRLVPASTINPMVPAWVDAVLARALAVDPAQRFGDIAEFGGSLAKPVSSYPPAARPLSMLERNPKRFWQSLALALAVSQTITLALLFFP